MIHFDGRRRELMPRPRWPFPILGRTQDIKKVYCLIAWAEYRILLPEGREIHDARRPLF